MVHSSSHYLISSIQSFTYSVSDSILETWFYNLCLAPILVSKSPLSEVRFPWWWLSREKHLLPPAEGEYYFSRNSSVRMSTHSVVQDHQERQDSHRRWMDQCFIHTKEMPSQISLSSGSPPPHQQLIQSDDLSACTPPTPQVKEVVPCCQKPVQQWGFSGTNWGVG